MRAISIVVIALVIMLALAGTALGQDVAAVAEYSGGVTGSGGTGSSASGASGSGSMPGTGAPLLVAVGGLAVAGVGALVARSRR